MQEENRENQVDIEQDGHWVFNQIGLFNVLKYSCYLGDGCPTSRSPVTGALMSSRG